MIGDILLYAVLVVLVDYVYLSNVSVPFGEMMKKIQKSEMRVNKLAAAVVYVMLIVGWYVFIYQEMSKHSYYKNLCRSFVLGVVIYSVFDFTNLAVIKDYRLDLAIIDSVWGGCLFATTTALFLGIKKFGRKL